MDVSKLPKLSNTSEHRPAPGSFCTQCGTPITPSMKFCGACGSAVQSDSVPVAKPAGTAVLDYEPNKEPSAFWMNGAEIWITAILGLIFIFMGSNFLRYSYSTFRGRSYETGIEWSTGPKAGTPVQYYDLMGFTAYTETGECLFGIALLLESVALLTLFLKLRIGRLLCMLAMLLTLSAVGYNGWVMYKLFAAGITPVISLLVVGVGGYMLFYQWILLGTARR